jgi:hypothetical protein
VSSEPGAGQSETKYLNISKKGSSCYVYDRKACLEYLHKASDFEEAKYTRAEIRLFPECALSKLASLGNKLTKFHFIDFDTLTPPEGFHFWKLFQDSCRYRGLQGALHQLPVDLRPIYEKAVQDVVGDLWQPEKLWATWPSAVSKAGLWP